ncbi:MAG: hypothetical protein ACR2QK_13975, partial [Acidimicrobiales bacterium]
MDGPDRPMAYEMFAPEAGRARTIVSIMAVLCLVGASCVSSNDLGQATADGDGSQRSGVSSSRSPSDRTGHRPPGPGQLGGRAAAFVSGSRWLGPAAPSGTSYKSCTTDYGDVDWTSDQETIVDSHAAASTQVCTGQSWYRDTAFQNGILTFMVLVGEATLADAVPVSSVPAAVVDSLR